VKPFVRVKSLTTGHHFDVHRSRFDPEKHSLVKRYPDASRPRRPKFRINYRTSAPKAVEGLTLPSSAGLDRNGEGS
jgi:hypothetical protein